MVSFSLVPGYFPWLSPPTVSGANLAPLAGQLTVTVSPTFYGKTSLSWTIPSYWGNCKFNVYSSQGDSVAPTKINQAPFSNPSYTDEAPVNVSAFNQTFYTIEVLLPNGTKVSSPPTTWSPIQNSWVSLRAKEIQRRENIFLQKFFGIPSSFFKKMFFGMRCPRCWNSDVEKVMDDHCSVCYGTGFQGGYWPSTDLSLNYTPITNSSTLSEAGVLEPVQISAWTTGFPVIQTFDLIYRQSDSRMFRVSSVQPTELQGLRVRQTLVLTELDKDSIEYSLI